VKGRKGRPTRDSRYSSGSTLTQLLTVLPTPGEGPHTLVRADRGVVGADKGMGQGLGLIEGKREHSLVYWFIRLLRDLT
jgi:hypothetical protein